ncbi:MAG TPA: DUF3800 domain-containing protein [Pyrinomonadaceae bacterium]|jgi:hypothetical protein|nr:DUF3800 domain-containing protein [Pyrinomonadaceae bacterium]
MPTHVLYIDDSGTKEYASRPEDYRLARRGNSRYFVFCGALLTTAEAGRLRDRIVELKIEYFRRGDVEIKSNWLRIPYERQKRYLDKYSVSEERVRRFVDDYYKAINEFDLMFVAAIVDKLHMQEIYPRPWYAPAVAYELILQRVQSELPAPASVAIIIDDMSGATPKGNQYKRNLKLQHLSLMKYGSSLRKGVAFPCLSSQRFINSAASHLVQVSDLAAYNVHRQFIQYGEEWETEGLGRLSTYEHFDKIVTKFRKTSEGRIQGYGIVKFPLKKRVYWTVTE